MLKKDENVELMEETKMWKLINETEELKQFYPIFNIDINRRSVSTTDYPVMNNCGCLTPFSNNSNE
ncbi:hypothetical protein H8356DRAFT_1356803 [Neocallimastix lanati (nom. inval.)]|nr:hypothetical protein H8356DRAFT_1356803 [Neocallimastix sp. JGI-2020a]